MNSDYVFIVIVYERGKVYEYRFETASVDGMRKWITKSGFRTKQEALNQGALDYNEYYRIGRVKRNKEMSYADYLRILMAFSALEQQTFRMMDIVEMDIRQTPGNDYFRMDGCVDRIVAEVSIKSNYGYAMKIQKTKKY